MKTWMNEKRAFGMSVNEWSLDCIATMKGMFLTNCWDLNEVASAEVEMCTNFFGREMQSDSQEAHVGENASFGWWIQAKCEAISYLHQICLRTFCSHLNLEKDMLYLSYALSLSFPLPLPLSNHCTNTGLSCSAWDLAKMTNQCTKI